MPKYLVNKPCTINKKFYMPGLEVDIPTGEEWRVQAANETVTLLNGSGNKVPTPPVPTLTSQLTDDVGFVSITRTRQCGIWSDFCASPNSGAELLNVVVGTGGAQVGVASTANHKGIWALRSGTAIDSGWRTMTQADGLFVTGGEVFEGIFQVPATFATTSQARMGYFNGITSAVSNDAMNYRVAHNGTNPTLTPVCRNNGTETAGSAINIVAGTWYSCFIVLDNAGTSCVFTLRSEAGAVLDTQTLTTNIPLNRTIGAGYLATDSTISSGVNRLFFDYLDIYNNKPMTR